MATHHTRRRSSSQRSRARSRDSTGRRTWPTVQDRRASTSKACSPTTSSAAVPLTTAPATPQRAAVRPGPAVQRGRRDPRAAAHPRWRERLARAQPGPLRDRGRGSADHGMDISVIYRLDRYLSGGDHTWFLSNGFPAARFTEPRRTSPTSTRTSGVKNGVQYGDLPEFCDFDYIAGVARVNAPHCGRSPRRRACRARGDRRVGADQRHRAAVVVAHQVAGWRLRGGVAADDQPLLDPCHRRRRRARGDHRPVQGQRHLRRPVGEHRRLPQPGGVPVPGPAPSSTNGRSPAPDAGDLPSCRFRRRPGCCGTPSPARRRPRGRGRR